MVEASAPFHGFPHDFHIIATPRYRTLWWSDGCRWFSAAGHPLGQMLEEGVDAKLIDRSSRSVPSTHDSRCEELWSARRQVADYLFRRGVSREMVDECLSEVYVTAWRRIEEVPVDANDTSTSASNGEIEDSTGNDGDCAQTGALAKTILRHRTCEKDFLAWDCDNWADTQK
ncbi:MAG: hypothetical protein ACRD0U_07790 [Acidimicrobiales bacterium]